MIHLGIHVVSICLYSTHSQHPPSIDPQVVTYDAAHGQSQIGWTTNTGQLTIAVTGMYLLIFAAQVSREQGGGVKSVDYWLRRNGQDEPGSAFRATLSNPNDITMVSSQEIHEFQQGDIIEYVQAVEEAGLGMGLTAFPTFGGGPLMPALHFTVSRFID